MNSDGCAKGNPGEAGAGGLIRDARGQWLVVFTCDLGICTSVTAELEGIRQGLSLAWDEGYRYVVCEADAQTIIRIIQHGDSTSHPHGALIEDFRSLLRRDWQCILHHTLREGNSCADSLVGLKSMERLKIFRNPPPQLHNLLLRDLASIGVPRP